MNQSLADNGGRSLGHSQIPPATDRRRRHLLIAGTGRAGTSFLVKYLGELGLDTHLGRHGAHAYWDEHAHAGLEDMPLVGDAATLPYVVKSPYAYQFIDALLARDDIALDGVIIPIRDLNEAASSRALTEIQHLHRVVPWLPELDRTWEQWALTPGGAVYSLNVLDQARLLALGLHQLVQRLVEARVMITFVHFPAMIVDADYLFRQLQRFLPQTVGIEAARKAHAKIADPAEVRVGEELRTAGSSATEGLKMAAGEQAGGVATNGAPPADRIESRLLRDQIRQLSQTSGRLKADADSEMARNLFELGGLSEELTRRADELRALDTALARAKLKIEKDRKRVAVLQDEQMLIESQIAAIRASNAWRYKMPLRAVKRAVQTLFG